MSCCIYVSVYYHSLTVTAAPVYFTTFEGAAVGSIPTCNPNQPVRDDLKEATRRLPVNLRRDPCPRAPPEASALLCNHKQSVKVQNQSVNENPQATGCLLYLQHPWEAPLPHLHRERFRPICPVHRYRARLVPARVSHCGAIVLVQGKACISAGIDADLEGVGRLLGAVLQVWAHRDDRSRLDEQRNMI